MFSDDVRSNQGRCLANVKDSHADTGKKYSSKDNNPDPGYLECERRAKEPDI